MLLINIVVEEKLMSGSVGTTIALVLVALRHAVHCQLACPWFSKLEDPREQEAFPQLPLHLGPNPTSCMQESPHGAQRHVCGAFSSLEVGGCLHG